MRARLQIGSRARGGAYVEHADHACDAGGVEAQQLVERRRVLPRVKRRAYGAVRGAEYREAGAGGRSWCTQRVGEGSTVDGEQEERTKNIWLMSVTPEVSQLEMSSLKFFKFLKSPPMSVMAETSQSAMRPCVAMAAVGLALNAWTAVFK
eukprot:scaffold26050_cov53-Phaeocystis_antarctica.AAC.2